jgi:septal ring factor EnvC (AmiA/AmiB activator)
MRLGRVLVGMAMIALALPACGQQARRENAELRNRLGVLQQENLTLKSEAASLRAHVEGLQRQLAELGRQKEALEEALRTAEARAAAQPGTKPPLKPRRAS